MENEGKFDSKHVKRFPKQRQTFSFRLMVPFGARKEA